MEACSQAVHIFCVVFFRDSCTTHPCTHPKTTSLLSLPFQCRHMCSRTLLGLMCQYIAIRAWHTKIFKTEKKPSCRCMHKDDLKIVFTVSEKSHHIPRYRTHSLNFQSNQKKRLLEGEVQSACARAKSLQLSLGGYRVMFAWRTPKEVPFVKPVMFFKTW